ncbi:DrmB family protein [Streptomyces sp. enrichment culture]|uniref:DrmB family protein n=1 Tax=Streptomyces sp. enrichment culture TaxID=1795815 RepID=UPI003F54808E
MSRTLRVRQSQTVVPFGVGAVFDIQGESFVATGIGDWPSRGRQRVESARLASRLGVTGFYAAPATANDRFDVPDAPGAPYIRFPSWLFCGSCRRMKRWRIADEKPGRPPRCPSCSPARTLAPMRFVQICQAGHLSDVDWWFWAHSRRDAGERRRCEERDRLRFLVSERASGLEALSVTCTAKGCGASRDLLDILGTHGMRCSGRNPWQRANERVECPRPVQIVQRTAGNLYYPIVHSALDIPESDVPAAHGDEAVVAEVREHDLWVPLCRVAATPRAAAFRTMIQEDTGADDALLDALIAEETGETPPSPGAPSSDPQTGPARPDLSREEWAAFTAPTPPATRDFALRETTLGLAGESADPWAALDRRFGRIVLADRLREVRALSGFTRVSPDATVVPADTARRLKWLPAVEVFGEGIFLSLNPAELAGWEADGEVRKRVSGMRADLARSFQRDRLEVLTGPELAPRFVLLHTLAHLLIRQLSFESGYTTASLRERVYARPEQDQYGILVYTAAGDAEGTLGGLVRQGEPPRLAETLLRMTEAAAWCSADPLCSEHTGQGFGNLNRAACHACALLPETSCETGNTLLDRTLVVGGEHVPGYLEPIVIAARAAAADALEES